MKRQLVLITTLASALLAMAPAPKPVVTIERISAVTRLSAAERASIAPLVVALDAGLQKLAAAHKQFATASLEKRQQMHADIKAVHDECHEQISAIIKNMTAEQIKAFHEYLHQQMIAAGIPLMAEHHSHQ
jgi:hypothetical protein